jgi:orotidine-5'-phosphate decarboxylase
MEAALDAMRERLIVALDVPTVDAARAMVARLGPRATFYKIGLELVMSGGLDLARELTRTGRRVFLDMKLLDIGNTITRATCAAADTGATFLTVHAQDGKTLRAAVAGKAGTGLKILGVTLLTNLDAADVAEQGFGGDPGSIVARRAAIARDAGCEGVVSSGREAAAVRAIVGAHMAIVAPGVRLAGGAPGDQARVATPQAAMAEGADYLVVGRPITAAADPAGTIEAYLSAMAEGARRRTDLP